MKMGGVNLKRQINTKEAPLAIGPYSQAISIGGFIFSSGQIPIDPLTGEMVEKDINRQTVQVIENLKAVLESENFKLKDVIKATIYLTNLKYFDEVNKVYSKYFDTLPPARSCIEVSRLPKDSLIEIEIVAYKK